MRQRLGFHPSFFFQRIFKIEKTFMKMFFEKNFSKMLSEKDFFLKKNSIGDDTLVNGYTVQLTTVCIKAVPRSTLPVALAGAV